MPGRIHNVSDTITQIRSITLGESWSLTLHDFKFLGSKIDICSQHQRRVARKIAKGMTGSGWKRVFGHFGSCQRNIFALLSRQVGIGKTVCRYNQNKHKRKSPTKQQFHCPYGEVEDKRTSRLFDDGSKDRGLLRNEKDPKEGDHWSDVWRQVQSRTNDITSVVVRREFTQDFQPKALKVVRTAIWYL